MLTKALTDDTDKQNKQIFLLTTHRDLKVVELTELVDKWTGRQVDELRVKKTEEQKDKRTGRQVICKKDRVTC